MIENVSFDIFNFGNFTIICLIKSDLSGNTVWPQASGFQKIANMDNFWPFQLTFVHSNCKRSSLGSLAKSNATFSVIFKYCGDPYDAELLYYQTARKLLLLYALTDVAVSSIKRSFEVLTNGSSRMNTTENDTEQPSPIPPDFYY